MNSYPDLKFIGLALTNANSFKIFNQGSQLPSVSLSNLKNSPSLIVTGESSEHQLMASLKYYKNRHNYVQKSLYHLFELSRNFRETRVQFLEMIVELMYIHNKTQSIQLVATTCIFNLTRQEMYKSVPLPILSQIINVIISVMQAYPSTAIVNRIFQIFRKKLSLFLFHFLKAAKKLLAHIEQRRNSYKSCIQLL